jgi:uncharacterized protein (DUF1330 family)
MNGQARGLRIRGQNTFRQQRNAMPATATATACYLSPEYQSAKAIRQASADADFIIIDGAA